MAQKHRDRQNRARRPIRPAHAVAPSKPRVVWEKKAPIVYGKAFIVLEDEAKSTFEFDNGALGSLYDEHRRMSA